MLDMAISDYARRRILLEMGPPPFRKVARPTPYVRLAIIGFTAGIALLVNGSSLPSDVKGHLAIGVAMLRALSLTSESATDGSTGTSMP